MKHSNSNECLSMKYIILFTKLRGAKNLTFCMKFKSCFQQKWHACGPSGTDSCCQKLFQSSPYVWERLWNTQAAVVVSTHITAYYFGLWEGAKSIKFCMKFESVFWQKWHDNDHKGLINDTMTSFNHPYTSMVGYEALKQQWVSLPKVQHPVYQAERMPNILILHEI